VALYRYRFRGKPFVSGMLFVVMMSPDIVMAISLLVLFMLIGIQLGFWSLLFSTSPLPALRGGHGIFAPERF
jgi:spermidine/putrescine transport system permease protein